MDNTETGSEHKQDQPEFKKPVLFGRIGKLPKKVKNEPHKDDSESRVEIQDLPEKCEPKQSLPPAVLLKEISTPIPYKEPKWSGVCPDGSDYALEVLKSGMIIDKIDLMRKPFYVFGRLANCDVIMAHPTISRHHAVLQYKAFAEEGEMPSGWYLFDLGSTHGTFVNKERLKQKHFTRIRVGHQLKFGSSSRTYIVLGPDFDCDGESELTVTEIKKRAEDMKIERDRIIKEAIQQREKDRLEEEKKREEQGIDWGMGEDAEDEPDLAENPYASTANEELYLEDPKKTLRGYFEREGHELTYDCEERGVGQFMCRVELPIDDARGRPIVAEVMHRGKKKEAVVACALEACRLLDRAGLLRQATHESRARKKRDWSADDYYDSDEDTFLDRTGAVERKRQIRMRGKEKKIDTPLTYDDLLKQIADIEKRILLEENTLERLRNSNKGAAQTSEGLDALDEYMTSLGSHTMAQKAEISKTKMSIHKLRLELGKAQRLADIARPAHLPPLVKADPKPLKMAANSAVYGKRIRLKEDMEKKPKIRQEMKREESEFVEEMDSDEEDKQTEEMCSQVNTSRALDESKTEIVEETKRVYGPMRPPDNYVIPDNYFEQNSDRDLPEIMEKQ